MKRKKKTPPARTTKPRGSKPSRARQRRPAELVTPEPVALVQELLPDVADEPVVALGMPEAVFAARVPPPPPEPPAPTNRRAIFYDVENASQPGHIAQVIEHLAIDRVNRRTDLVAVGNWRVIGADTARLLARHGAQLVHSAPSTGVRDWSDLRIAVSAGAWLAAARPGDMLEIVSDDRAFDAVGDVAAGLGITFRRLSYRSLTGGAAAEPRDSHEGARRDRRSRHRRYGRRPHLSPAVDQHRAEPPRVEPLRLEPARPEPIQREEAAEIAPATAQTAPHDEIVHVVRELAERSPNRSVLIDNLARTLKARGFSRPPGSPRLVTRLRRIREIAVSSTGMITLVGEPAATAAPIVEAVAEALEPAPATAQKTGQRRRRRRGRGRPRPAAVPVSV
jgi:hypothetical protein